jgi:adenosylhomocysteine nucleosidase
MRLSVIALVAALLSPAAAHAQALDTTPRTALITAFEPEIKLLLQRIEAPAAHQANGVTFTTGRLGRREVVLFLSGVSMVNAAMTTQMALDRFAITDIAFSGIAGGVDPELKVGDVVVAERWGGYLETVMARETPEGLKLPAWFKPDFAPFGAQHPNAVRVRREGAPQGERRFWFEADPRLLAIARAAAAGVALERCPKAKPCLPHTPRVVVGGNGVSGPSFVDNAAFRDYTQRTFQARVLDMETAAVAQVAFANGKPFVAFRSLSDLAGGGPGENEMEAFMDLAADNAATVSEAYLKALAAAR